MTPRQASKPTEVTADLFRLLVESVVDYAIFLLDPTGVVRTWNAGARRLKGYEADEIIGHHFSTFYPEEDVRRGKPAWELESAAREGRFEDEGWRIRKDGSSFWANVVITALRRDGELVGFAKVTRDLTERKHAEDERGQMLDLERKVRAELQERVDDLRTLQGVSEAGLSARGLDQLLESLTDRVSVALRSDTAAILLLEDNQLVARAARGIEELVEQGVRVPIGHGFAGQIAARRQPIVVEDLETTDVGNELLWQKGIHSLAGVPLLADGRVIGVLHVGSVAPRRFSEREVQLLQLAGDRAALAIEHARLVQAEREARSRGETAEAELTDRDAFLSVAAHELKTPLAGLQGLIQLLKRRVNRGNLDEHELRQTLETIERQSQKATDLVGSLLDVGRVDASGVQLNESDTNLSALVGEASQTLQLSQPRHRVVVEVEADVRARIDCGRFEQALNNLLDNAVKFSPDGGTIEVSLSGQGDGSVEIAVRDHGVGVGPEHQEFIFNRFYQAHGATHRSGLGLGLYIARNMVELHGGTLRGEFPNSGGSRFVIHLPPERRVVAQQETGGKPVLVVDDDDTIRRLVTAALTDEGFHVLSAPNGAEALRIAKDESPALILLDMRMPIMDGWEFARRYRQTVEPAAPIVVMTAAADARQRAGEIGAQGHISKPFDLDALIDTVGEYVLT
ncbi:MAG: response regulator [Chloroflexi bacterium]|nr:response regulator [Chloroflexota bacterium]